MYIYIYIIREFQCRVPVGGNLLCEATGQELMPLLSAKVGRRQEEYYSG